MQSINGSCEVVREELTSIVDCALRHAITTMLGSWFVFRHPRPKQLLCVVAFSLLQRRRELWIQENKSVAYYLQFSAKASFSSLTCPCLLLNASWTLNWLLGHDKQAHNFNYFLTFCKSGFSVKNSVRNQILQLQSWKSESSGPSLLRSSSD